MQKRIVIALVVFALLLIGLAGASNFLARQALLGKWQSADGKQTYEFLPDGEVLIDGKHGDGWADKTTYTFGGSNLLITASMRSAFTVSINGATMVLTPTSSGGGFPQTYHRTQK